MDLVLHAVCGGGDAIIIVCTHVTCCKNRNALGMRQIKSGVSKQEFLIQNQHLVQVQSSYENLEFRRGVVKKTEMDSS